MTHHAKKVSIVTEKLNERAIEEIVVAAGATGYTVFEGSGKGSHGLKPRRALVNDFTLVKIEVIVGTLAMAEAIAEEIADRYFEDYAGIVYINDVDVLRREKF